MSPVGLRRECRSSWIPITRTVSTTRWPVTVSPGVANDARLAPRYIGAVLQLESAGFVTGETIDADGRQAGL